MKQCAFILIHSIKKKGEYHSRIKDSPSNLIHLVLWKLIPNLVISLGSPGSSENFFIYLHGPVESLRDLKEVFSTHIHPIGILLILFPCRGRTPKKVWMQQGRKESGQEGGFLAILEVSPMPSHWVGMRNTVHTPSSSSRSVHFKLVSRMTFMVWVYPPKEAWCNAVQPLWSLWKSEEKTAHSLHRWIVGRMLPIGKVSWTATTTKCLSEF